MDKSRWSTLETSLIDSGDVSDHPYEPQFQAFVDSIGTGEPMPLTDFDTAFESHRVVFAADLSAVEGRPVKLVRIRLTENSYVYSISVSLSILSGCGQWLGE